MKKSDRILQILAVSLATVTVATVVVCSFFIGKASDSTKLPISIAPPVVAPPFSIEPSTNSTLLDLALAKCRVAETMQEGLSIIQSVYASSQTGEVCLIDYIEALLENGRSDDAIYAVSLMGSLIRTEELILAIATNDNVAVDNAFALYNYISNDETRPVFEKIAIDLLSSGRNLSIATLLTVSGSDEANELLKSFKFYQSERYEPSRKYYERYTYDSLGNVVYAEINNSRGTTYTNYYYKNGRISEANTKGPGNVRSSSELYEYDSNGRLVKIVHNLSINGKSYLATTVNTYDKDGRIVKIAYVMEGHEYENETKTYSYDSNGRLVSYRYLTYENRIIEGYDYVYNSNGQVESETNAKNHVTLSLSYYADGRLYTRRLSNGGMTSTITYIYDTFGNLIEERTTEMGSTYTSVTYDYVCLYIPAKDN